MDERGGDARDGEQRDRVVARAARALARRPHSRAELRERLGVVAPAGVVEGVIDDLERLGYVDDAGLALVLAERRLAAGWGAIRVGWDLERLGIRGEAAAEAVALTTAGEIEAARHLLWARGLLDDPRRAWSLLARRGFAEETAEAVVSAEVE